MSWLSENLGTIIVAVLLIGVISAVIAGLIRDRKKGKSSCGCNCAHCAMAQSCHSRKH
ncbi:MAG: FeoB-associated Cys-rich membrane protein [Clostridia bacterium]|nr:FeoB-associated Cys-rich membrane protein [Clostridia bacterium]MBQ3662775.1 FeoB-associated Cys-rich membrane protein [Clostridia bacterium]